MNQHEERRHLTTEALDLWHAHRADEAVEVWERCLPLFKQADLRSEEFANFCNNFATAAVALGQLARAETMFRAAYAIYDDGSKVEDMARVDLNLGNVYRGMRMGDRSTEHFQAALRGYRELGDDQNAAFCLVSLALNSIDVGRIEDARASLAEIDLLDDQVLNDPELRYSYSFQRARIALQDGHYDDAVAAMEESLEAAKETGDPRYVEQSTGGMRAILQAVQEAKRHPLEPRNEPATTEAPQLQAPLLPGLAPSRLAPLAEVARKSGVRTIILPLNDQVFVVTTDGPPHVMVIDPAAPDLLAQLDSHGMLNDPRVADQWLGWAQQFVALGIERRERGDLAEAYVYQRLALFVALRQESTPGISAIVGNIRILRESIRDVTDRAQGPARNPDNQAIEQEIGELLNRTLEFMRHDAVLVEEAVWGLARTSAEDPRNHLAILHACHSVARIAGNSHLRAAAFGALLELGEEIGDPDVPVTVAAEEVAQMDLQDVLSKSAALRMRDRPTSDSVDAWPRYRKLRSRIPEVQDLVQVSTACRGAFTHLCHLRLRATTGGGAFGHEMSYTISSLLQMVGRDLVGLLHRMERDEDALGVAETLLARSMADWLARTHAAWAVPHEFRAIVSGLTGSFNATAAAGLDEIHAATRMADAPLLYYVRQRDHYLAWLIRKDGRILTEHIESPASQVAYLLPSIVSEERGALEPELARQQEEAIDRVLRALHDTLFPVALREALVDQGEKLVIVADPSLQSIPFCALRTPDARYLIEERELVFWPSVTSCLNLEAGARVPVAMRARILEPREPLVIGIRSFDREYSIPGSDGDRLIAFDELPNAAKEAAQVAEALATEAVLDDDATREVILNGGRGTEIIHVATHGYLDEAHPRQSFLALADGVLTADSLYRQDRGVQTNLVVLSACETGLGGGHADSVIGLANAFLIAGAGSVVSTLWPISDDATPIFMSAFYGSIKEGKDLATSLCHAQRTLLKNPATSDLFFWGPFVLTGRVANPLNGQSTRTTAKSSLPSS